MLFHEIYSSYYNTAAFILRKAVLGTLTGKELNALIQAYAFGESALSIPEGLTGEKWRLMHKDLSTPLFEPPEMPLTTLEKRWMKAMLMDPRMQLFEPDMTGLEDVRPLFTPDMIVYYDRYTDGDPYRDPEYIAHFRTVLKALKEKRNLFLRFETRNQAPQRLIVSPHHLEYSEKDDRFRLVAAAKSRRWTINLLRITHCELARMEEWMELKKAARCSVTFDLVDRRNAMERVLLHFSHLEKETKRIEADKYRVTLRYDRNDETEMVIRLLSFGPVIRVIEPDKFIALMRERIEWQKRFTPLPLIRTQEQEEA